MPSAMYVKWQEKRPVRSIRWNDAAVFSQRGAGSNRSSLYDYADFFTGIFRDRAFISKTALLPPFPPRATAFFLLFSFIHPHNRSSVIAHFVHCYCYARYNRVIMASLSLFLSLSPSLFLSQVWPVTQGGASHDQKTDVSISFVLLLRLFFFLRGSVSFLLARETTFISK